MLAFDLGNHLFRLLTQRFNDCFVFWPGGDVTGFAITYSRRSVESGAECASQPARRGAGKHAAKAVISLGSRSVADNRSGDDYIG